MKTHIEKILPSASFPKGIDSGPYSVVVVVVIVVVVVVVVQGNVTTAAPLLPPLPSADNSPERGYRLC